MPRVWLNCGEGRRRHAAAIRAWKPSDKPEWLNEETYRRDIQPKLAPVTVPAIRKALGISKVYATNIRNGKQIPHPRQWLALANEVRNDRAANGGKLTPNERAQINHQQNNASRQIYDDKHNTRTDRAVQQHNSAEQSEHAQNEHPHH